MIKIKFFFKKKPSAQLCRLDSQLPPKGSRGPAEAVLVGQGEEGDRHQQVHC